MNKKSGNSSLGKTAVSTFLQLSYLRVYSLQQDAYRLGSLRFKELHFFIKFFSDFL